MITKIRNPLPKIKYEFSILTSYISYYVRCENLVVHEDKISLCVNILERLMPTARDQQSVSDVTQPLFEAISPEHHITRDHS